MSVPPSDIEQLIRLAQQGDGDAVTRLYELFAPVIYRYIAYRVPTEEAEDLTAEVFVKMVEGLPAYRATGAPFEAWLYRIASARIIDHYRRSSRHQPVELSDQMPHSGPLPEDALQRQQEIDTLRAALGQLNEEQQTVLLLRFMERRSHDEDARIMGKTVSNVKSIQHRALVQLTRLLGSEGKARHYLRGHHDQ